VKHFHEFVAKFIALSEVAEDLELEEGRFYGIILREKVTLRKI